eukprot:m.15787 g.15787  ORF g.15787 m.15787 type:complete len:66 (-) comp8627_c0_seq2:470-667(-)
MSDIVDDWAIVQERLKKPDLELKILDLSSKNLGDTDAKSLATFLPNCPKLEKLEFVFRMRKISSS